MSAKNCLVVVEYTGGEVCILPGMEKRLSKSEAQRTASGQLSQPAVKRCLVVCEVMEVNPEK